MALRAGASCTEGGTRTQRDEHEVSSPSRVKLIELMVPSKGWKIS